MTNDNGAVGVDPRMVTLDTIAEGAACQLFEQALARVLENIDDPNTAADAKRAITLTFTIKPDEDRRHALVAVACATKIAGIRPIGTHMFIGRHKGRLAAAEPQPQADMFPQPVAVPTVVTTVAGGAS